jgi:hypothetical protein
VSKQQKSIRLKIEQPEVMCSGRSRVKCYYKANITFEFYNMFHAKFKSHGKEVTVCFVDGLCITEGWEDLKVV